MDHPARILVVDDEPDILESVHAVLESVGGMDVVTSSGPSEALGLLEGDGFDAVITDFLMPEMDGCTFIKRLHEARPDMPIGVMTAYGKVALKELGCANVTVDSMLAKPFSSSDLVRTVKDLVKH